MNYLANLFSSSYRELWKAIIRPYRDVYTEKDLGPEKFTINKKLYKRSDFSILNNRNIKLICSYWEPYDEEREYIRLPCVIYLHGNSSSRCEVIPNLKYLLPLNITVFAFDFAGCGQSEGEYISLGWYETMDVECVIKFLRSSNKVSTIGLWGRSMGAVTSIMYASKDPTIGGIFLDSPFYSLNLLIDELSKDKVSLPNFIVRQVIKMIKETVKDKGKFNIDDIEPVEFAKKCFVPSFFCHGRDDTFVNVHHCNDLYTLYPGEKSKFLVEGDHNSLRPDKLNEKASEFFYNALKCKYLRELNDSYNGYKMIFRDWRNPNNRTPSGDNKTKEEKRSIRYGNYGTVPSENKHISKIKSFNFHINNNDHSKNNNNNDKNIKIVKYKKYKFKNQKNSITPDKITNKSNNNIIINNKNISINNSNNIYKIYKTNNLLKNGQYPYFSKEFYNIDTYKNPKYEGGKNQNFNNLSNSISQYPKYNSNFENIFTEKNNNSNLIDILKINNHEMDYINNQNNFDNQYNQYISFNNKNNYNSNKIKEDIPIKKYQVKKINQIKNIRKHKSPEQNNLRYAYPSPTLQNKNQIISFSYNNNIKSMAPMNSFNLGTNPKKDYFSINTEISNSDYYTKNNSQLKYESNYFSYNNQFDIPIDQNQYY